MQHGKVTVKPVIDPKPIEWKFGTRLPASVTKEDLVATYGEVTHLHFLAFAPRDAGKLAYKTGRVEERLGITIREVFDGYAFVKVPVVNVEHYLKLTADIEAEGDVRRAAKAGEKVTSRTFGKYQKVERRKVTKALGGRVISGLDGLRYLVPPVVQAVVESIVGMPNGHWAVVEPAVATK